MRTNAANGSRTLSASRAKCGSGLPATSRSGRLPTRSSIGRMSRKPRRYISCDSSSARQRPRRSKKARDSRSGWIIRAIPRSWSFLPRCGILLPRIWRDLLEQDKVVPVDQFRLVDVAEYRLDFARRPASNAPGFLRVVVDQSTRYLGAFRGEASDHCAALEFTVHAFDPDRQEALASGPQGLGCSSVESEPPGNLEVIGEPLLARCKRCLLGGEQSSDCFSGGEPDPDIGFVSRGDHGL